jgi:hypothetical protein
MLTAVISSWRGVMARHPAWLIITVLAAALVGTVEIEQHRVHTAQAGAASASLAAANLAAQRDSTRNVALENRRVAALLGDSMRVVERQAQQIAQRRDQLDRALGGERRARYALSARIDSLESTSVAVGNADTTPPVRRARFRVRRPPYTVAANVVVPAPPDTARLTLQVALDPVPIGARIRCAPPDGGGIRAATLVVSSPPWARIRLAHLEQSPDLCRSPAVTRVARPRIAFQRLVVGVGVGGSPQGRLSWGWFVGTGFAIGI